MPSRATLPWASATASARSASISPDVQDPGARNVTFDELVVDYAECARGLLAGGADILLVETVFDTLNAKAALKAIAMVLRAEGRLATVPVMVSGTITDQSGRTLSGQTPAAFWTSLSHYPLLSVGFNCALGARQMRPFLRELSEHATTFVSAHPNAGLPNAMGGYDELPRDTAGAISDWLDDGLVNLVGGCCGTTPDHIRALVAALRDVTPHVHEVTAEPRIASAMRGVDLGQEPRPTIVGERVNTQGSRKIKEMILADDYDGALAVAREQVEFGAHVLDVCVALTERTDEAEQLAILTKKLAMGVEAPLMIDSTEPDAIAAALDTYPGRMIVNSINMENGRERIERVVPIVKKHGAAVVALTIDEDGMAKTPEAKLAVARKIHDIVVDEYGLPPESLIFDALTFTLATGEDEYRDSGAATIEGIRLIKENLPGVYTSLGVSNVSFGLSPPARATLNSVFLARAVDAGLDLAMINPTHNRPLGEIPADEVELADDLIFARREDALPRFIAKYEGVEAEAAPDPAARFEGLPPDEIIFERILHRVPEGVEDDVDAALDQRGARANDEAIAVLNEVLLPAMKEVGDRFGRGELILPYVLQSAEVMKRSVAHVEQYLDQVEGYTKGTVIMATVYGDVHDIGKNLVGTILKNNGYTVHDLGRQVPVTAIIDAAEEHGADVIGVSALLVSTSKQMPLLVQELAARGMDYPVLIGGAAINRQFGRRTLFLEDGDPYAGGVFYCKDAFDGLSAVDRLQDPDDRPVFRQEQLDEARESAEKVTEAKARPRPAAEPVQLDEAPVPGPPFWGAVRVTDFDVDEMFARMDEKSLYKMSWGGRGQDDAEFQRIVREEFEPRRAEMERRSIEEGWIVPRATYGYFPAGRDGDAVVVFDPDTGDEAARFDFPRQDEGRLLCLADYLRPMDSGARDVIALQAVTVGQEATEYLDRLQAEEEYTEAYFAHGLAVEAAEGMADLVHARIKRELGLGIDQGRRYSWGYPACPDIEQHVDVLRLLAPHPDEMGMGLTSAFQLTPEQSTAAIIMHHPQATYFSARRRNRLPEGAA